MVLTDLATNPILLKLDTYVLWSCMSEVIDLKNY